MGLVTLRDGPAKYYAQWPDCPAEFYAAGWTVPPKNTEPGIC